MKLHLQPEHNLTWLVLSITVVFLPLLLVPSAYDGFRFPKVLLVRAAAVVLLAVYAIGAIWSRDPWNWRSFLDDPISKVFLFLLGWCALAAVMSPDPTVSWWAWGDVAAGVALFTAARGYARHTGSATLLWLIFVPAILTVIVLVIQALDLWHPLIGTGKLSDLPQQEQRLLGRAAFLGNRDDVGVYLLIPLAVALAFLRKSLLLSSMISLVLLGGIILSTTLTAIAVAVIIVALELWRLPARHWRGGIKVMGVLVVLVAGVIAFTLYQPAAERRVTVRKEALVEGDLDKALGGRLVPFAIAALAIAENPVFGIGPGRFPFEYTGRAHMLSLRYPHLTSGEWLYFDMVHNDYLEIASEAGVPALAGTLLLLFVYLRSLPRSSAEGSAGALAVVAISVAALGQFPLQLAAIYGTLAISAGAALGHVENNKD